MIRDTESGLILPNHIALEQSAKSEETWTYDTVRKLRYAAKEADDRDVDMTLTCRRCHQPIVFEMDPSLDGHMHPTGKLVCKCKTRRVIR